jgi:hypothetical protein
MDKFIEITLKYRLIILVVSIVNLALAVINKFIIDSSLIYTVNHYVASLIILVGVAVLIKRN